MRSLASRGVAPEVVAVVGVPPVSVVSVTIAGVV
jgi:hypothetical protein